MSKTNFILQDDAATEDQNSIDDLDIQSGASEDKEIITEQDSVEEDDGVTISKSKLAMISTLLNTIQDSHDKISQLLAGAMDLPEEARVSIGQMTEEGLPGKADADVEGGRIIEGVFDGENMIGPDGKQYSVPANYASKSKLVEGDILKLTITPKGTFLYKQIGPIDRNRLIGNLIQTENGSFIVETSGREWKVLTASVTYFKGRDGDEIVILVPKVGDSKWAAVENIVRKTV